MDRSKTSGRVGVGVYPRTLLSGMCDSKEGGRVESEVGVRSRSALHVMPRSLECVLYVKRQARV